MERQIAIGRQDFERLIDRNCFYVDKTSFIKDWWGSEDDVTLINRPRRFGKTLNMSMLNCFFSVEYKDRGDLFQGLSIWEEEKYRELQGTYPVISLSFADVKQKRYIDTRKKICQLIKNLYCDYSFLLEGDVLNEGESPFFRKIMIKSAEEIDDAEISSALQYLSKFLFRYYGKKVIILLDEYDTPLQEAFVHGYWEEMVEFTRSLFNATFKTNPYMERAIMTGITRISKESMFSDMNNLKVITTTSEKYATAFGFTEEEVFAALEECGYGEQKEEVKRWYDGFVFGKQKDIYNPWPILNYLDTGELDAYWVNTSSNALAGKLVREGSREIKKDFELLLKGENIFSQLDEQIVYNQLDHSEAAIWSLLLASGYLKVISKEKKTTGRRRNRPVYELSFTNYEVKLMFENMVQDWFEKTDREYNDFLDALLEGNLEMMNEAMNRMAKDMFGSFDVGRKPSEKQPERFYHGFVLGLIVDLSDTHVVTSNRESGYGRYDVMIEPKDKKEDAIILEFKVYDEKKEKTLEDTVSSALKQIEDKQYETDLLNKGFTKEQIRKYGFAFEGETVLIG